MLSDNKILLNSSNSSQPDIPTSIYKYVFDATGENLYLSQRFKIVKQGYNTVRWEQEDNNYELETSPAGIEVFEEGNCLSPTYPLGTNSQAECTGGQALLLPARFEWTSIGAELFFTRQFKRVESS
ncbi:MAG: hypothetical protein AAGD96_04860 [Chloroflexota bacterium]